METNMLYAARHPKIGNSFKAFLKDFAGTL